MYINKSSLLYGFFDGIAICFIYPIICAFLVIALEKWMNLYWAILMIVAAYIFLYILILYKNIKKLKRYFLLNMSIGYITGIIFFNVILECIYWIIYHYTIIYYPPLPQIYNEQGRLQLILIKMLGFDVRGILSVSGNYIFVNITYLLCKSIVKYNS